MNGHDFPEQFDPEPFPDEAEYNAYLDDLAAERMAQIDRDLALMFEADQRDRAAAERFLSAAEHALSEIEKVLRG